MRTILFTLLLVMSSFGQGLTLRSPLRDIAPVAAIGPPAYVSETIVTAGGLITSPLVITYATAVSAGNTVALGLFSSNLQGDIASVTDTKGNTYTQRATRDASGNSMVVWIYSSTLGTSVTTSDTITVTWNSAALSYLGWGAASFSGVSGIDVTATGTDNNASTVSASASTTVANTAIYGVLFNKGHSYASGNFTAISSADVSSGQWFYTMQKDYSSTGSKDIGGTCTIFQGWTTCWVAFK